MSLTAKQIKGSFFISLVSPNFLWVCLNTGVFSSQTLSAGMFFEKTNAYDEETLF